MEHFAEPAMNRCRDFLHLGNTKNIWQIKFGVVCNYSKESEDRSVVVQHF